MDTIILRFRDANRDGTIEKHRGIIDEAGYVWWGWWKRESEPERHHELQHVREMARRQILQIGLFDNSIAQFYLARATDCVSAGEPIFSPEPRKTPSYYSNEKLSAWFKLAAIDPISEARFVESFGELPTDEHTLFPISRDGVLARAAPVSTRLNTSTVLHLSDIHFGVDYAFPTVAVPGERPLLNIIEDDLRDTPPGLIIVSGDITSRADANVLQDEGLDAVNALTVLAAGSAGSSRLSDELRDNSFTTIRFENGQFQAVARRYNKGLAPRTYFSIRGNAATG